MRTILHLLAIPAVLTCYTLSAQQFKETSTVIVAVIDTGADTTHEDLLGKWWTNPGEIPGNGIDDDHNGYIDDIHGWNFLGGKDGSSVTTELDEPLRTYMKEKRGTTVLLSTAERTLLQNTVKDWQQQCTNAYHKKQQRYRQLLLLDNLTVAQAKEKAETDTSFDDLFLWLQRLDDTISVHRLLLTQQQSLQHLQRQIQLDYDPDEARRKVTGDNCDDISDTHYGNNNIFESANFHGTQICGVIAANRNNEKGIDGIAGNVRIMVLKAVPAGDERDKDIALAIRYAADNGAQIINASFGKYLSPHKEWVAAAIRYAAQKGVLIIHAAGNKGLNLDTVSHYPSNGDGDDIYPNMITVGALNTKLQVASFSNYGSKVDVFASGEKVPVTISNNRYAQAQGSSIAAAVVTGMAARMLSEHPGMKAVALKEALLPGFSRLEKSFSSFEHVTLVLNPTFEKH